MRMSTDKPRIIIDDFAELINKRKHKGLAPTKDVINFRNERVSGKEREIFYVPIELLRYRKDNGRIASDVLSYERSSDRKLDEKDTKTQDLLREFLYKKDPEKTETLIRSIKKDGQSKPAIITCDGFLIDGNRRKMVLELLNKEDPSNDNYKEMRVIILPGKDDEGGPPTIKEIELLENRYQLQQDGKSEYFGLDRALSIKRKKLNGITLEAQLMDSPECAGLDTNDKEFKKKVDEWDNKYLKPLQLVDDYLESLCRPEHYESIKDRWYSFIDLSNLYNGKLQDQNWRLKVNLEEDDIGSVQDIAYKIIRKQSIKGRSVKLHQMIRDIPKFLKNPDAKKSVFLLVNNTEELTKKEKIDHNGNEYPLLEQDKKWGGKNENVFAQAINKAYGYLETQKETEDSLTLIKAALDKINHSNMNVKKIPYENLKEFMDICKIIIDDVTLLKTKAWERKKSKK